jgi:hypothetical protein
MQSPNVCVAPVLSLNPKEAERIALAVDAPDGGLSSTATKPVASPNPADVPEVQGPPGGQGDGRFGGRPGGAGAAVGRRADAGSRALVVQNAAPRRSSIACRGQGALQIHRCRRRLARGRGVFAARLRAAPCVRDRASTRARAASTRARAAPTRCAGSTRCAASTRARTASTRARGRRSRTWRGR